MNINVEIYPTRTTVTINNKPIFCDYMSDKITEFFSDIMIQYQNMIDSFKMRKIIYLQRKYIPINLFDIVVESTHEDDYRIDITTYSNELEENVVINLNNEQMEQLIKILLTSIYEFDKTIADIENGTDDQIEYITEFIDANNIINMIRSVI